MDSVHDNISLKILTMLENLETILLMPDHKKRPLRSELNMTPAEIRIAGLIRQGKKSKEIAGMLSISESAVNFHRNNIRKKLGLTRKGINLRSFLMAVN